ncbi:MAG TPA: hypothetical protein VF701_12840 [Thermoanaerobaculia bacterium]
MTEHVRLLAEGLEPLVEPLGHYSVFAAVSYGWADRLWSLFRAPDPVVEVERYAEKSELKIHVGGAASPVRRSDPTMTLSSFVTALKQVPPEASGDPIFVAMSIRMPEEPDYTLTMNVPTRSVSCEVQGRKRRILLSFRAVAGKRA